MAFVLENDYRPLFIGYDWPGSLHQLARNCVAASCSANDILERNESGLYDLRAS